MERYCLLPLHDDILLPFAVLTVQLDLDQRHRYCVCFCLPLSCFLSRIFSKALLSHLSQENQEDVSVAVFPVKTDSIDTVTVLLDVSSLQFPSLAEISAISGKHRRAGSSLTDFKTAWSCETERSFCQSDGDLVAGAESHIGVGRQIAGRSATSL